MPTGRRARGRARAGTRGAAGRSAGFGRAFRAGRFARGGRSARSRAGAPRLRRRFAAARRAARTTATATLGAFHQRRAEQGLIALPCSAVPAEQRPRRGSAGQRRSENRQQAANQDRSSQFQRFLALSHARASLTSRQLSLLFSLCPPPSAPTGTSTVPRSDASHETYRKKVPQVAPPVEEKVPIWGNLNAPLFELVSFAEDQLIQFFNREAPTLPNV
jgi:hypothetical protein